MVVTHTEAVHRPVMLGPMPFRLVANPRYGGSPIESLSHKGFLRTKNEITSWHGYGRPRCENCPPWEGAGVKCIRLKDEADASVWAASRLLGAPTRWRKCCRRNWCGVCGPRSSVG